MNDSYWLFMPFKLKDTGVTLSYLKEDMTQIGELSDVLRLTFKEVGATPDNAYWIWVSKDQNLIKQWAYFKHFLTHYLNLYHHGMTIRSMEKFC